MIVRQTSRWPEGLDRRAFSLLEVVGVLAIISIVAAILTPNLARRLSRQSGEREDQALALLAEGLSRHVRTFQTVPGASSWVTNLATLTGLSLSEVRYARPTDPATARVYLIHPGFSPTNAAGADPLYTQSSSGAASVTNARLLLLSSHKGDLALPVTSGKASSASAFENIWNWNFDPATKSPPSGWGGSWANNGEYLHVQRINLSGLFHRVTFSNADFPIVYPSIQVGSTLVSLSATSAIDTFFLQGTYVKAFKDSTAGAGLDLSQSIETAVNFLYDDGSWRVP
jgi:prepilin-type N-terminal cleavage/methylation domain-containing protein